MKPNTYFIGGILVVLLAVMAFLFNDPEKETDRENTAGKSARTSSSYLGNENKSLGPVIMSGQPVDIEPYIANEDTDFVNLGMFEAETVTPFNQSVAQLQNDPNQVANPLPDPERMNQPAPPENEYIVSVGNLVKDLHQVALSEPLPAPHNLAVTNALLGQNPQKIAFLPRTHSRIDDEGKLIDSWGTAYLFTAGSQNEVIIRSAGPDRIIETEDDIVFQ